MIQICCPVSSRFFVRTPNGQYTLGRMLNPQGVRDALEELQGGKVWSWKQVSAASFLVSIYLRETGVEYTIRGQMREKLKQEKNTKGLGIQLTVENLQRMWETLGSIPKPKRS